MSDRIAIFNHGKIEQIGKPSEIYDRPTTQFVAEFIGETNLLSGRVTACRNGLLDVAVEGGQQIKVASTAKFEPGEHVKVSVRPERIELAPAGGSANELSVRVSDVVYRGDHLQVIAAAASGPLVVKSTRKASAPRIGDEAVASFSPEQCWIVA